MTSVFWVKPEPEVARRETSGLGQLVVWLPVVIAVLFIAAESTDTFSAEHTSGWIRPWVERFTGHINDQLWGLIHHVARKSGHFTGYGMVCLTFLRAWLLTLACRADLAFRPWRLSSMGLAIFSTFTVASLDEWHQTFIPSRTGLFSDVLLDTCGATVLCAIVWLIGWRGKRARAQRESHDRLVAQ